MMILLARQIFIALLELYYNIHVHIYQLHQTKEFSVYQDSRIWKWCQHCTQLLLNTQLHAPQGNAVTDTCMHLG